MVEKSKDIKEEGDSPSKNERIDMIISEVMAVFGEMISNDPEVLCVQLLRYLCSAHSFITKSGLYEAYAKWDDTLESLSNNLYQNFLKENIPSMDIIKDKPKENILNHN